MRRSWHRTIVRAAFRFVLGAALLIGLLAFTAWAINHPLQAFVICALVTVGVLFPAGGRLIDAVFARGDRREP